MEKIVDDSVADVVDTKVQDTPKTEVVVVDSIAVNTTGNMGLIPYVKRKSSHAVTLTCTFKSKSIHINFDFPFFGTLHRFIIYQSILSVLEAS